MRLRLAIGAVLALGTATASDAQTGAEPFAMRGIRLGITMEQFRAAGIVNDDPNSINLATYCSDEQLPLGLYIEGAPSSDRELGVIACGWFSQRGDIAYSLPWNHFIDLGRGKGPPTFHFIDDGTGYRLFRITVTANEEYYQGIRDALVRTYGEPARQTSDFQTRAGATFPSETLTWRNAASEIRLEERCQRVNLYCLTYLHNELAAVYAHRIEARDDEAADRI